MSRGWGERARGRAWEHNEGGYQSHRRILAATQTGPQRQRGSGCSLALQQRLAAAPPAVVLLLALDLPADERRKAAAVAGQQVLLQGGVPALAGVHLQAGGPHDKVAGGREHHAVRSALVQHQKLAWSSRGRKDAMREGEACVALRRAHGMGTAQRTQLGRQRQRKPEGSSSGSGRTSNITAGAPLRATMSSQWMTSNERGTAAMYSLAKAWLPVRGAPNV